MAIHPRDREWHDRFKAACHELYPTDPEFFPRPRSVASAARVAPPVARDPLSYTSAELVELRRTDPARCASLLAARAAALGYALR